MNKIRRNRMSIIKRLPCMACVKEGCAQPNPTEVHHLVDMGNRELSGGDAATIPLCGWHHRGEPLMNEVCKNMRAYYGPSMAKESKKFAELYGTQRELLASINEAIGAL